MKNYEKLGDDLKIAWCEDFQLNGELYTQVSGYVFNDHHDRLHNSSKAMKRLLPNLIKR